MGIKFRVELQAKATLYRKAMGGGYRTLSMEDGKKNLNKVVTMCKISQKQELSTGVEGWPGARYHEGDMC